MELEIIFLNQKEEWVAFIKEVELEGVPKIKLSGTPEKITNPGYKKLYRAIDRKTGLALADVISIHDKEVKRNELLLYSTVNPLAKNNE